MVLEPGLREELLTHLGSLRAYAISLIRDPDRADDLVHETIVRSLGRLHLFQPGTDFRAWLFAILRNLFYNEMRRRAREVHDSDGTFAASLTCIPEQTGRMAYLDLLTALQKLPPHHREVLILVGAQGLSYEEAAAIRGCAIGTIKSRVCRARALLAEHLGETDPEQLGPDALTLAALDQAA